MKLHLHSKVLACFVALATIALASAATNKPSPMAKSSKGSKGEECGVTIETVTGSTNGFSWLGRRILGVNSTSVMDIYTITSPDGEVGIVEKDYTNGTTSISFSSSKIILNNKLDTYGNTDASINGVVLAEAEVEVLLSNDPVNAILKVDAFNDTTYEVDNVMAYSMLQLFEVITTGADVVIMGPCTIWKKIWLLAKIPLVCGGSVLGTVGCLFSLPSGPPAFLMCLVGTIATGIPACIDTVNEALECDWKKPTKSSHPNITKF